MIKRFFAVTSLIILCITSAFADRQFSVTLGEGENSVKSENLGPGYITFSMEPLKGEKATVDVKIENFQRDKALVLFKVDKGETAFAGCLPHVKFDKTYPGSKGERSVSGCKYLTPAAGNCGVAIPPADTQDVMKFTVNAGEPMTLIIPIYIADFNPKELHKKGPAATTYTLMECQVFEFQLTVEGWNESDLEYVAVKKRVENLQNSIRNATFCSNPAHRPSLAEMQKKYNDEIAALQSEIKGILSTHHEWFSSSRPHEAYTELLNQLNAINPAKDVKDCGAHTPKKRDKKPDRKPTVNTGSNTGGNTVSNSGHSCAYCSMTGQQLYHKLDATYQQMYTGKISKDAAKKTAQSLYNCFKNNGSRKTDSYSSKIAKFYNRIMEY